jgi:hypothetical protein
VIELPKVAELMHYNILSKLLREECDLVVEVEISPLRTAAPTCLLVLDTYLVELELVDLVKLRNLLLRKSLRRILVVDILAHLRLLTNLLFSDIIYAE